MDPDNISSNPHTDDESPVSDGAGTPGVSNGDRGFNADDEDDLDEPEEEMEGDEDDDEPLADEPDSDDPLEKDGEELPRP